MSRLVIIAPNIKNGGAKELLEYLLEHLAQEYWHVEVLVYLDDSMRHIEASQNLKIVFLRSTFAKIALFAKQFENALYFGNLPPLRKSKNSILYFHNAYLLMGAKKLVATSLRFCIKYTLQQLYISLFVKNVGSVACQSKLIQEKFIKKYAFFPVAVLPFFRVCEKMQEVLSHKEFDFCYVSLAHPHKNHALLLEAMQILSDEGICVRLAVTIENDKIELREKIDEINSFGVVYIENLGVIPKSEVCKLYARSKCSLFPSKEETFGLGLIEAVVMGLDVISADLEYVYEVVEPSMVFNADSAKMCARVIQEYLSQKQKKSRALVTNEIDSLIQKLLERS